MFDITMTNGSSRHIRLTCEQIMGMHKSCDEDHICNIHKIATFNQTLEDTWQKLLEKICAVSPSETNTGK